MIKNLITKSAPINNWNGFLEGIDAGEIAGAAIEHKGGNIFLVLKLYDTKQPAAKWGEVKWTPNQVALRGFYVDNKGNIFLSGDHRLRELTDDTKSELARALRTIRWAKGTAMDVFFVGPNEVTIAFLSGVWMTLADKAASYDYHVFGLNAKAGEVFAFRSLQGKKNAIVAGVVENGRVKWRQLTELPQGRFFEDISKLVQSGQVFYAHVMMTDSVIQAITISEVGKTALGQITGWEGRPFAVWTKQDRKDPMGLIGLVDGEFLTVPMDQIKDKSLLNYVQAAR